MSFEAGFRIFLHFRFDVATPEQMEMNETEHVATAYIRIR